MSKGIGSDIFPNDPKMRIPTNGRPKVNRDLVKRLLQEKRYTYEQIADYCSCSARTIRRIKDELIDGEELTENEAEKGLGIIAANFDDECERATGMKYSEWIKSKRKDGKYPFRFARRTWEHIWNKPSLVLVAYRNSQLGDKLCMQFLNAFREDKIRIRHRKKTIRPLFKFLGRDDLNDKHLTMTRARDPPRIKRVPHIEMIDFPLKMEKAFQVLEENEGKELADLLKFKLCTGMRTGNWKEERGWLGLKTGSEGKSYILFNGPDEFRCHVLEKMHAEWDITWLPKAIRRGLYEIYKKKKLGEPFTNTYAEEEKNAWYETSKPILRFKMQFHDFRKVFITWIIIMGVPLEVASSFNVGWLDLNTLKDHYLHIRRLLKNSDKAKYRENIPDWFKEGLHDYIEGFC